MKQTTRTIVNLVKCNQHKHCSIVHSVAMAAGDCCVADLCRAGLVLLTWLFMPVVRYFWRSDARDSGQASDTVPSVRSVESD